MILHDAIETSRPLIVQQGHVLTVSQPEEELLLDVDPTRMVQVFSNLLNNASKFTPRGGRIELIAERDGDTSVEITVRDNGLGLSEDASSQIFEMFMQVDRSHTQSSAGLGIGLTLVRRLVEMHGGTVVARSEGVGKGSEFVVRLDLATPSRPVHHTDSAIVAASSTHRRILVADDNVDGARTLAMMLQLVGHDTRIAHDGVEALALARDFRPEVMILDIAMPGLDGHHLARRVRSEPWGKDLLLIAASGWGLAEHKMQSRDAGFDHHLVKPIEFDMLEEMIARGR